MGEVTSYCFMMNSSAAAELSDNKKGFKNSFYFKEHVPVPAEKSADGKSVTRGKDMELCKVSCREQGPRESDCSSGLLTLSRSARVYLMMLGVKTAAMFLQRNKSQNLEEKLLYFLSLQ